MAVERKRKRKRKREKEKKREKKSMIIVVPSSDRLTACTATLGPKKKRKKVNDYSGTIV